MKKQWVGKIAIVLAMVLLVMKYYFFQNFEYTYILSGLVVVLSLMGGYFATDDSPKKETKM
ncbi:MAG TPA: hypothetical protein VE710_12390 [Candidatus Bathyarchaeia archaeon]|nr:hypothetical protein [Candidatus Bathyarchaeia archaeon]